MIYVQRRKRVRRLTREPVRFSCSAFSSPPFHSRKSNRLCFQSNSAWGSPPQGPSRRFDQRKPFFNHLFTQNISYRPVSVNSERKILSLFLSGASPARRGAPLPPGQTASEANNDKRPAPLRGGPLRRCFAHTSMMMGRIMGLRLVFLYRKEDRSPLTSLLMVAQSVRRRCSQAWRVWQAMLFSSSISCSLSLT